MVEYLFVIAGRNLFASTYNIFYDVFSDEAASKNEGTLCTDTGNTSSDKKKTCKMLPDEFSGTLGNAQGDGKPTEPSKQKASNRSSSNRMPTASPSRTRDQGYRGIPRFRHFLMVFIL